MPPVDKGSEPLRQFLIKLVIDNNVRAEYDIAIKQAATGNPTALNNMMTREQLLPADKKAITDRNVAQLRLQECNVQVSNGIKKPSKARKKGGGGRKGAGGKRSKR